MKHSKPQKLKTNHFILLMIFLGQKLGGAPLGVSPAIAKAAGAERSTSKMTSLTLHFFSFLGAPWLLYLMSQSPGPIFMTLDFSQHGDFRVNGFLM